MMKAAPNGRHIWEIYLYIGFEGARFAIPQEHICQRAQMSSCGWGNDHWHIVIIHLQLPTYILVLIFFPEFPKFYIFKSLLIRSAAMSCTDECEGIFVNTVLILHVPLLLQDMALEQFGSVAANALGQGLDRSQA